MSKVEIPKVVLIDTGDYWEALYVDGKVVYQDHEINKMEFLRMAEEYDFKYSDVVGADVEYEDFDKCQKTGSFPDTLSEFVSDHLLVYNEETDDMDKLPIR